MGARISRRRHAVDFNNILIGSDQPGRLVEYYAKLLGPPTYSDDSYSSWQIGRGHVAVGAHSEVHGKNAQPGRMIWNIETADVKEVFARFVAEGAIVIREPYSFEGFPDSWIATLADPDGNYFQLMTPFGAMDDDRG
jgi:predicted enzyme related to lactoylglutathione lyase